MLGRDKSGVYEHGMNGKSIFLFMISVICPIYNEERYIGKCIESIMRQNYPKEDMEVLFVDGMSTDRTRAIIAGYLPQCPATRISATMIITRSTS